MKTAKRLLVLVLTIALCLVPMGMSVFAEYTNITATFHFKEYGTDNGVEGVLVEFRDAGMIDRGHSDSNGKFVVTINIVLLDDYFTFDPPTGYDFVDPSEETISVENLTDGTDFKKTIYLIKKNRPYLLINNGQDIDLGTGAYGTTPQTTTVEIRNIGYEDAHNGRIALTGADADQFTVSPTSISIRANQSEDITITPAANLSAKSYSAQLDVVYLDSANSIYITEANITYKVLPLTAHIIKATAGNGGSIDPIGTVTVNDGDNQTFTITADADCKINDVKVDGDSKGAIDTYTFENVTQPHTIHAEFVYTGTGGTTGTTGSTGSTTTTSGSRSSSGGSSGTTTTPSTSKSTVTPQQIGDYSWRVDLPVLGFVEASVDGVPLVKGEDCIVKSGSTILSLTDSYVNSLRSGTHTLRMEFLSATATVDFTVTPTGTGGGDVGEPNAPALTTSTNDTMNPSTGGVEAAGSIAVLLAVVGLWAVAPRKMGK